jgi:signal transduction histidine kinase
MTRPVLYDHLHEFLDGLADWIEGNTESAERAFSALVHGHALQRLGYGVGLETLTREYLKLRIVVMRLLLDLDATPSVRESMLRLHEGMDRAISDAMHRYARRREEVRERFISILGHDLRDPLSTVLISSRVLASADGLDDEQRQVARHGDGRRSADPCDGEDWHDRRAPWFEQYMARTLRATLKGEPI